MITTEQVENYTANKAFRKALEIPETSDLQLRLLGQGEYNINYIFVHPISKKKLVLRLNAGSQMNLLNQIEYEYKTLKLLENSGRTPLVFYVDKSRKQIDLGVLVMEFLSGKPLDYRTDLNLAAQCLADIHSTYLPKENHLIRPNNPLKAILEECENMAATYLNCEYADSFTANKIESMILSAKKLPMDNPKDNNYLINTELNSGNFLINGIGNPNYLIDWEKPIIGEVAQDIAHFLAPTTTFWKTDIILSQEEKTKFIDEYIVSCHGRIKTENLYRLVDLYETATCLRGITWCSMAWVLYHNPTKLIQNPFTYKKIQSYLSKEFLTNIEKKYFAF